MENNETIEKYLKGQLTPEEEKAFRERLNDDKNLREEVLAMALMIRKMKQRNQEQEAAIVEEAQAAATSVTGAKTRGRRWYYWAASIAALFVIGFFAVKPVLTSKSLCQDYASANWAPNTTRGGDDQSVVDTLTVLFNNVSKDKDLEMTIDRLENTLENVDYELYLDDINWYLALAYIKESQFTRARTILESIIKDENHRHNQDAKKLYKELKKIPFV